jgi:cobalt transporter subunit CbtB
MTNAAVQAASLPRVNRVASAVAALFLGLGLLYVAGFAWPSYLHNATHDSRHAFGLPCH